MVMEHKGTLGNQRIPARIVIWPLCGTSDVT